MLYGLGNAIFGKSQEDNQRLQIQGQKEMTDYNYGKQIQMIGDSTKAQLNAYKENGLNTALMYEGGGAGGTTAIQSGGMPSAPIAPNSVEMGQFGLQSAQALANIELTKAQTANVEADTIKKAGADTSLINKQIENLSQGITNQKTINTLNETQNKIASLDLRVKNDTINRAMDIIGYEADILKYNAANAMYEAKINQDTVDEKIKIIERELTNKALETVAIKQGIQLDKSKIEEITNGIQQKWKEIQIESTTKKWEHNDRLKAIEEYTANAMKVAGIMAAGQIVGDVVKIATRRVPQPSHRTNEFPDGGTSTTYYK